MDIKRISLTDKQLETFCQRHHVVKLSFYGSVLRDDFRPDSDIDILVEKVIQNSGEAIRTDKELDGYRYAKRRRTFVRILTKVPRQ